MSIAAFFCAYAGFSALCLGMDRHYEAVFDRALPSRHRVMLRLVGASALALSLWLSTRVWGWSYGAVEWIGILSFAGLMLIWWVSYRPVVALVAGAVCAMVAPLILIPTLT